MTGGVGSWLLGLGSAKPVLTALLLPPALPLLLMLVGFALLRCRHRTTISGRLLLACAWAALWLLSCQTVAVWLERALLAPPPAVSPTQLRAADVQMVIVLGGGVEPWAPEYAAPQLSPMSMERLRYGAWLARQLQVPLGFTGGVGWGNTPSGSNAASRPVPAEADLAQTWSPVLFGVPVDLVENGSRDTVENAARTAVLLRARGVQRIALVTHAWHMPRAMRAFAAQGVALVPAPMGFTGPFESPLLDALPSGHGLAASRRILREWLGRMLMQ